MTASSLGSHSDSENSVSGGAAGPISVLEEFRLNAVMLLYKPFLRKQWKIGEEEEGKAERAGS